MVSNSVMKNKRFALISTYNKENLKFICKTLNKYKIEIISTGSTAVEIKKNNIKCHLISDITRFKEILDGRVKTLHPKIYASILYKREEKKHLKTFNEINFPKIDFVIVNLYPFKSIITKNKDEAECLDMIDIGGPTLLRAGAKNYKSITTICDTKDYKKFAQNLYLNNGKTTLNFRKKMAQKSFSTTFDYDLSISNWFKNKKKIDKRIKLKYGENPNQKALFVPNHKEKSILEGKIQGKEIGYNNFLDAEAGLNCINEFIEPTCVIIKHNNPCGVASSSSINLAFEKALNSDSESSFGGIVVLNRSVNAKLAKEITKHFFEIIIANNFYTKALNELSFKKKLILIKYNTLFMKQKKELRSTIGGILIQKKNLLKVNKNDLNYIGNKKVGTKELNDIIFAAKVCKHVKSNAIVLVKNKKTIGIGAGQMSRSDATKLAILKIPKKLKSSKFVCASDAFFPFIDNIKRLKKSNCKSIVVPFGSINDEKIINYAKKVKIDLYLTKYRFFKH